MRSETGLAATERITCRHVVPLHLPGERCFSQVRMLFKEALAHLGRFITRDNLRYSFWVVAHRFNVVAFWVNDEGTIIVRVIEGAQSWGSIFFSSGLDCDEVKSIYLRTSFAPPRQVTAGGRWRPPPYGDGPSMNHTSAFLPSGSVESG